MLHKGNKFTRYPLIKDTKNGNKVNLEQQKLIKYREKCDCGSGKIFGKCCYRSDHRIFNLNRYLEKLKNIKLKMHDLVLARFIEDYKNIPEIREIADNLSDDLNIYRFNQINNDIINRWVKPEKSDESFRSAIRFEALTIDWTLPGHDRKIFQESLQFYLRKASERAKKCYDSYSKSQFSFYEVIRVKKAEGATHNTWVLLRDLFTKKEYVMKDPLICSRLYIWNIVIGRLYRVAGFNLFSTSVFILNPDQHKKFNRVLFMFWLRDVIEKNPNVLEELNSKFPLFNRDFSHKYASFSGDYFYDSSIFTFLKQNSPLLIKIMDLMQLFAPEYPLIIKSPDRQDIVYAECVGELTSEKLIEAIEVLRSDTKYFREVPELDKTNKYSFDYFITYDESPINEEIIDKNITPKNLIQLSKEAIVHKIQELFQKTIVFGATSIMSDWSMEQKVDAMENINVGPKVRVGFVEIKRSRIKLVTYSKKSMQKLLKDIKKSLKLFILQLSAPTYTDILGRTQKQDFPYDFSAKRSQEIYNNSIKFATKYQKEIYPLEKKLENNQTDDYEEESLFWESRMMRHYLMKRWINQKIPLLGGKTPKESITDAKNIHLLIDLIKDRENDDDRRGEFDSNRTYSIYLGIDVANYQNKNTDTKS